MIRLGRLVTVAALVFLTQGCIAAVALPLLKGGSPDKLSVDSGPKEVKAELGKPIASQGTPDGGRVDTYDYRLDRANERSDARKFVGTLDGTAFQALGYYALFNIVTYGALDLAISSFLVYHKLKTDPRSRVRIAFGPDDRVAWIGSPPPYGPPDAAVPLSIGGIRESCRSQDDADPSDRPVGGGGESPKEPGDRYVKCVARGFAMWGIE